jgi:5-hydroxyisourate hydrolase-like protein (transthyretin family)
MIKSQDEAMEGIEFVDVSYVSSKKEVHTMKKIVTRVLVLGMFVLLTLVGCGGGGDDSTPTPATGLTITGVVNDPTGASNVPIAGATVTLRKAADNSSLATTSTAANGSYTLTNVPASTDVYVNTSKASYASMNTEVMNFTANLTGKDVIIVPATLMKGLIDQINGSVGGASWSDPFYTGKSWFAMSIRDATRNSVPGVSVAAAPVGPAIVYNNGSDVFSATGPTVGEIDSPLVAASNASTGIYTFTMTKGSTTHSVKIPLVLGEVAYTEVRPW